MYQWVYYLFMYITYTKVALFFALVLWKFKYSIQLLDGSCREQITFVSGYVFIV